MKEYDVIVVGARMAGGAAAKAAAERGASVIILERHPEIGHPRSCMGVIPDTRYTEEILQLTGEDVCLNKLRWHRVYGPSGKLVQEIHLGERCYMLHREEFARRWARLAANAGAEIALSTKVTGLLKENGKIIGVTTGSKAMPEVRGKLVIGADGLHSTGTGGIAKEAGLTTGEGETMSGIVFEVTNVKDIEPDVQEFHYGAYSGSGAGWVGLSPTGRNTCMIDFPSAAEFERLKAGDSMVSKKFKNAQPLRMMGFSGVRSSMGGVLPKTFLDGLILAGDAAGFNGIVTAIVTGRYAGEVAAEAIQKGNVSEAQLSRYEDMWRGTWLEHMYDDWRELLKKISELSAKPEALEEFLVQEAKQGKLLISGLWGRKTTYDTYHGL